MHGVTYLVYAACLMVLLVCCMVEHTEARPGGKNHGDDSSGASALLVAGMLASLLNS